MRIVVDVESGERKVLGIYVRSEEDAVFYNDWETGAGEWAPVDCVEVVPGRINYRGPGGLVELPKPAAAFACEPDESAGAADPLQARADEMNAANAAEDAALEAAGNDVMTLGEVYALELARAALHRIRQRHADASLPYGDFRRMAQLVELRVLAEGADDALFNLCNAARHGLDVDVSTDSAGDLWTVDELPAVDKQRAELPAVMGPFARDERPWCDA